jgi:hypothetical protein
MNQKKVFFANKTLTAVLLCLLVFTSTAYGKGENIHHSCNDGLVITFDFETGNMWTNVKRKGQYLYVVKKGQNATFEIINFNRLAYKATINGETFDNFTTTPGPFQSHLKIEEKKETLESVTDLNDIIKKLSAIKTFPAKLREILHTSKNFRHLSDQKESLYSQFQQPLGLSAPPTDTRMVIGCMSVLSNAENELQKAKKEASKAPVSLNRCREIFALESLIKEFTEKKYIEEIEKILSDFDEKNFSVSLTIPTVDADEVRFTAKFEPIDKKKSTVLHQLKGPVVVKIKGGWKIDFSTGVMFNLNAHDRTYRFDDDDNDESMVILRENEPQHKTITPVIGAMMHVYPRQRKGFKWAGVTFGLSGGKSENLSYYLGTGLMFGSKNRFVINAGGVLTKFNDLKPRYRDILNNPIEKNDELKPENLTESVYKIRLFVGLTYNLGK